MTRRQRQAAKQQEQARSFVATPAHQVVYQELADLVGRHKDQVSAVDILAIASNMVGKLIAMQDQRTITKAKAFKIVSANIEAGNKEVIDALMNSKGSA